MRIDFHLQPQCFLATHTKELMHVGVELTSEEDVTVHIDGNECVLKKFPGEYVIKYLPVKYLREILTNYGKGEDKSPAALDSLQREIECAKNLAKNNGKLKKIKEGIDIPNCTKYCVTLETKEDNCNSPMSLLKGIIQKYVNQDSPPLKNKELNFIRISL